MHARNVECRKQQALLRLVWENDCAGAAQCGAAAQGDGAASGAAGVVDQDGEYFWRWRVAGAGNTIAKSAEPGKVEERLAKYDDFANIFARPEKIQRNINLGQGFDVA